MLFRSKTIRKGIERLKARIGVDGLFREFGNDLPLRSDLFSLTQLEEHAEALAAWHEIDPHNGPDRLLARLAANENILRESYKLMIEAVKSDRHIVPAGEWLLDNYYLIEEQIRTSRRHLPKQYSRGLPRLLNGPSAGYPCVYDLALELISHVDGRIDANSLRSFVAAYQKGRRLKLGELWAVPIMMRQALIENLRRVAARIATGRLDRNSAGHWADQFIDCAETSPKDLVLRLADMVRPNPVLTSAFVAEMARRLQGQSPALAFPLTWVEQRLAESGQTIEQMVQIEGQQQAVDQVSIGNSINSLRELEAVDWREFVENLSVVEQELCRDPAGVYSQMDFSTRDHYRHVVEEIAKKSPLSEQDVSIKAVQLAHRSESADDRVQRKSHVGYFLVDKGLPELEQAVQTRFSFSGSARALVEKCPLVLYVGSICLIALIVMTCVLQKTSTRAFPESGRVAGDVRAENVGEAGGIPALNGPEGREQLPPLISRWIIGGLLFLGATHLGVGLVNWLVTLIVKPHRLPRMDFSHGIPEEFSTLIAVPTMLVSQKGIRQLLDGLEVCYLANREANLQFCLLTDLRDDIQQIMPEDDALLAFAGAGIESLNKKYRGTGHQSEPNDEDADSIPKDIFYLLHRPRRWNPQEQIWMGYERKRGKLADLNALILQSSSAGFSLMVGDTSLLKRVKYVITLDTDTLLPRDAARQLIGTLAHILNQAWIDRERNIVTEGYGILQPGVAIRLGKSRPTWFIRLFGGEAGIDPYTRAVSDVYQDLFGEGSFIGKGIYDVATFSATTDGRFADNQILSHDLIEGCYARSGLVSDICVYETYPSDYQNDVRRRHRWIRGDWQIAKWVLPSKGNPISLLSRWKILDNVRRSVIPFVLMWLLVSGWLGLVHASLWTIVVIGIVAIPSVCASLVALVRRATDLPWLSNCRTFIDSIGLSLAHTTLTIAFLPYEAFYNLDAIFRTMVRVGLTHRRMLEWKTASEADGDRTGDIVARYRTMWIAPTTAITVAILLTVYDPSTLLVAGPILTMWLVAPLVAWKISQPPAKRISRLSDSQTLFLHETAEKTWRFFQKYVGPEDNWLPPDNFQEFPINVIAHRTSPTNIGMSLLSNLAAYDFGYLTTGQLLERTGSTLKTMGSLERFRGHFLNWYDTKSLQGLYPKYVSSVDSGNLSGHLLTLRQGLLEMIDHKILSPRLWDSLAVKRRHLERMTRFPDGAASSLPSDRRPLDYVMKLLRLDLIRRDMSQLSLSKGRLEEIEVAATKMAQSCSSSDQDAIGESMRAIIEQCHAHLHELTSTAIWLTHRAAPASLWSTGSPERIERMGNLQVILQRLDENPTLGEIAAIDATVFPELDAILKGGLFTPDLEADEQDWLSRLRELLHSSCRRAIAQLHGIEQLASRCRDFADCEYDFLYDAHRRLLAIGYNVSERRRDASFYDLLASEARLASFVAISQGKLEQDHWFALGRSLTTSHGKHMLVSWSGSMFEYLMPMLVMPTFENTLLDQTYLAVIDRQIQYGRKRGVPWGVSESGYNATDAQLNYQYRAFGVPGLGFKRGLADDLVIAPYATAMALMVSPEKSCLNLQSMASKGFTGQYGFYEAIDYTPSRLSRGQTHAIVKSYMAHHQGMSFLSMAYVLLNRPMQKRFESDPQFQATELLLHERIPQAIPFYPNANEVSAERPPSSDHETLIRVFNTPNTPAPEVHLLSNGRYHVMITNGGGGHSMWKDLSVTRWREDCTRDNSGIFCYLRDVNSGDVWSTSHQPTLQPTNRYEAIFSQARAEFRRRDSQIKLHTEIAVSPEDDIELRRTTIVNRSKVSRTIELTSYAEVVLAAPNADATHPAFSNLFVQTEILAQRQAIVCTRRPRSHKEKPPWMIHLMAVRGTSDTDASFETDRMKFIGRGCTTANPEAMNRAAKLSNSEGSVLDPIVAIRRRVTLEPEESCVIDLVIGMSETREAAIALIDKYQDHHLADRVFDMAWTHGQVVLRQLNASETEAQMYGRLASSIVYSNMARRASPAILTLNRRGQSGLWGHGISGDLPIVLLRIANAEKIDIVRQLLKAHCFWRLKGLAVDLVIWNEDSSGYRQVLQDLVIGLVSAGTGAQSLDRPGGIFIRRAEQMSDEDRILLQTVARVIIVDTEGTLSEQIEKRARVDVKVAELVPSRLRRLDILPVPVTPQRELSFHNGLGGFTSDGREYVIRLEKGEVTPAPWANVLANPNFGTVVSESGSAYTWSQNAHEFRVTPWNNDPVTDSCGEAFYLRDEESGHYWSPTPQPARGNQPYVCRHGYGYSVFEYNEFGITSELWVYVATDAPIKFAVLKIKNNSGRSRKLSATAYCEWVLGEMRSKSLMHVVTEIDPKCGALLARNHYSIEFSDRIAFLDVSESSRSVTGDRTEFIGRNGNLAKPAAMARKRLSGKVGAGFDPGAAIQVPFDLADNREREIVFTMGVGRDIDDVRVLVQRFRGSDPARRALEEVWRFWNQTLGAVHVETPDPALNLMANGWLVYQTLSCRFWARSGYYQSGGAFGFRDQLQDAAALLHAEPKYIREHLLRCAGHQFPEGDVQHWWHPPVGRGVRTHFSDDFLWLPWIACRYVMGTGDTGILDEFVPFIDGRAVKPDEDAYYDLPTQSLEKKSFYDHCVLAIMNGFKFGVHGLPLIGCGDWNDGMNLVGENGKGESVWLAFFLYEVLEKFTKIARQRGDADFADRCDTEATRLRENIELHGWDGEWYRRAYFDNGEPLGSATNAECQIDSLPQSWSILSGAGDLARSRLAMEAVDRRLVRRDAGLIQLFDPPFDKSSLDPGYIKGYVPGVRENGGQYTHAAIWTVMAFAKLGDHRRAWELFSIINPINHGATARQIAIYKVEPYVVAADIYAVAPHTGRGGWTWYTGSSSWMYRLITESLLGLHLEIDELRISPCIPAEWKSFDIHYRYRDTFYHITVRQSGRQEQIQTVSVDGIVQRDSVIKLTNDRAHHQVSIDLGCSE